MPQNRKLLRVGMPTTLHALQQHLTALRVDDPREVLVYHHNRELILEEPAPTFPEPGDGDGAEEKNPELDK